MLTYALMFALVIFIAVSTLYGIRFDKEKDSFMSINDSNFLRGFWCIIVVLVHIPVVYQNSIQDICIYRRNILLHYECLWIEIQYDV